jgi:CRP-like cAMP-binding protein
MDARDAVQHMRLFRGAGPADLNAVAALAELRAYGARERLFDPLHPADALFAILIGMVEITLKGNEVAVVTVGSGQSIGDIAFFTRGPYEGSACAREPTHALRIPFDGIDRLLTERPSLALCFYRNAAYQFAHHLRQIAAERDRPYL